MRKDKIKPKIEQLRQYELYTKQNSLEEHFHLTLLDLTGAFSFGYFSG